MSYTLSNLATDGAKAGFQEFDHETQDYLYISGNTEGPQGEKYAAYAHITLMVTPAAQLPEGIALRGEPTTNITINIESSSTGSAAIRGAGKADDGLSMAQQFANLPEATQRRFWKVLQIMVDRAVGRKAYTREQADFAFSKEAIQRWFNFHLNKD